MFNTIKAIANSNLTLGLSWNQDFEDKAVLLKALGDASPSNNTNPTESATATVKFNNGDGDEMKLVFSKVIPNTFRQTQNTDAPVTESADFIANDVTVTETLA